MKTWIKRTLIGLAVAGTLFGGLAAYAHNRWSHGWHGASAEDIAEFKARAVDRIAGKLALDTAQKARLSVLADKLAEQRAALVGTGAHPRTELQGLIAGNTFDRARASQLIDAKVGAITTKSPEVVTALADFYDSLNATQQAQVREFMARRGHRGHGPAQGERGG
jgi:protein CpxP